MIHWDFLGVRCATYLAPTAPHHVCAYLNLKKQHVCTVVGSHFGGASGIAIGGMIFREILDGVPDQVLERQPKENNSHDMGVEINLKGGL